MADLDHFKSVNDRYGHLVGDGVLREVAARLMGSLRPYDSIGRYGGEEFLIVEPGCTLEKATMLAERLRQFIAGEIIRQPSIDVAITCSLGVAYAIQTEDLDHILKAADAALYRAKLQGRNRVVACPASEAILNATPVGR